MVEFLQSAAEQSDEKTKDAPAVDNSDAYPYRALEQTDSVVRVAHELLKLLKIHSGSSRVVVPMFKTIDVLLTQGVFEEVTPSRYVCQLVVCGVERWIGGLGDWRSGCCVKGRWCQIFVGCGAPQRHASRDLSELGYSQNHGFHQRVRLPPMCIGNGMLTFGSPHRFLGLIAFADPARSLALHTSLLLLTHRYPKVTRTLHAQPGGV